MDGVTFPEIPCFICTEPVDLQLDLSCDENGKAVHIQCYLDRIVNERTRQTSTRN